MNENKVAKGDFKQELFNTVNENVRALETLFPSVVKDGQVDFEALTEELGQFEEVGEEKYGMTWAGKQNAKKIAQEDIVGRTLKFVPEESKDSETTENLYIEGDNLEVLKLLRQNYYGAIKMIYIDPPYNTGNDFVYKDKFNMDVEESDKAEGSRDDSGRLQRNLKSTNRYHANWLNMMYPRLKIAKDLLTDDGVAFISIDDNEQENLKKICNDVFGENNFIFQIAWRRTDNQPNIGNVARVKEYIITYAKNNATLNLGKLPLTEKAKNEYRYSDERGVFRRKILLDKTRGRHRYPVKTKNGNVLDGPWMINEYDFKSLNEEGGIYWTNGGEEQPYGKLYLAEKKGQIPNDFWGIEFGTNQRASLEVEKLFNKRYFDFPKAVSLLTNLTTLGSDKSSIILDFFSGSATTAHAVMQLNAEDGGNRKFIMVQIPEEIDEKSEAYKDRYKNICEIGKERIRRAGDKIKEEVESANEQLKSEDIPKIVPDIGFKVFRTAHTNIRWNYEELDIQNAYAEVAATTERMEGQITTGLNMMNHKDQLDFMPHATDIDVVYEILLRQRDIPLSAPVETLVSIGERTYLFSQSYLVCLETDITHELIEQIAALNPLPIKFVFRDSAFEDDINLKDETIRRFRALVARNTGDKQKAYTVEFI